jgi:hypothetical protein
VFRVKYRIGKTFGGCEPRKEDTLMEIISMDSHKRYSQVCVQDSKGRFLCEQRINHGKGNILNFLSKWKQGDSQRIGVGLSRGCLAKLYVSSAL